MSSKGNIWYKQICCIVIIYIEFIQIHYYFVSEIQIHPNRWITKTLSEFWFVTKQITRLNEILVFNLTIRFFYKILSQILQFPNALTCYSCKSNTICPFQTRHNGWGFESSVLEDTSGHGRKFKLLYPWNYLCMTYEVVHFIVCFEVLKSKPRKSYPIVQALVLVTTEIQGRFFSASNIACAVNSWVVTSFGNPRLNSSPLEDWKWCNMSGMAHSLHCLLSSTCSLTRTLTILHIYCSTFILQRLHFQAIFLDSTAFNCENNDIQRAYK